MTRHYSTRDFFRQMPNALLARYFQGRNLFGDVDFAGLKETQPEELFTAWLELPGDKRNIMDAEFRDIFELSCEKGFRAIIDEAEWHLSAETRVRTEFVERLAALANHYERAMITFLDYNPFWKGATLFYHADTLPYWHKRKNLLHQPASLDMDSRHELADLIRNYFHHTEGRGKNCGWNSSAVASGTTSLPIARDVRNYPEDYSQQSVEWVDGQFARRPAILKLPELPADPKDERIYDLAPLRQKSFDFVFDVGSGIQGVAVKKLRLSSKLKRGDRITVEADAGGNSGAVYDLLDRIGKSVPLHMYNVTQVELAASVIVDADKPPKSVTIRITHPNSCSLKYDELDLKLRDMLEASGIEPKEPDEGEEAPEAATA